MAKIIHTHALYDMIWDIVEWVVVVGGKLYWPAEGVEE